MKQTISTITILATTYLSAYEADTHSNSFASWTSSFLPTPTTTSEVKCQEPDPFYQLVTWALKHANLSKETATQIHSSLKEYHQLLFLKETLQAWHAVSNSKIDSIHLESIEKFRTSIYNELIALITPILPLLSTEITPDDLLLINLPRIPVLIDAKMKQKEISIIHLLSQHSIK